MKNKALYSKGMHGDRDHMGKKGPHQKMGEYFPKQTNPYLSMDGMAIDASRTKGMEMREAGVRQDNPYNAALKADPNLNNYIKTRNNSAKGSPEYVSSQKSINAAYNLAKKSSSTPTTSEGPKPEIKPIKELTTAQRYGGRDERGKAILAAETMMQNMDLPGATQDSSDALAYVAGVEAKLNRRGDYGKDGSKANLDKYMQLQKNDLAKKGQSLSGTILNAGHGVNYKFGTGK